MTLPNSALPVGEKSPSQFDTARMADLLHEASLNFHMDDSTDINAILRTVIGRAPRPSSLGLGRGDGEDAVVLNNGVFTLYVRRTSRALPEIQSADTAPISALFTVTGPSREGDRLDSALFEVRGVIRDGAPAWDARTLTKVL